MVGGARDPVEIQADRLAAQVLSGSVAKTSGLGGAAPIRRACCENCTAGYEEDTARTDRAPVARRRSDAPALAPGSAPAPAGPRAGRALAALGGGRLLSAPARAFFEPRFGRDLSGVRLHTGTAAARAARSLDAAAFTRGRDIAFGPGALTASTLAHELAHVAMEGRVGAVRRKLTVVDPGRQIPRPGGKGVRQTNAQTIQKYLEMLCTHGFPKVKSSGEVTMWDSACGLFYGLFGTACACLCDIIDSKNQWRIEIRDKGNPKRSFPHTKADKPKQAKVGGSGSGGLVVVPSPNDRTEYGAADKGGNVRAFRTWEIVAHELCGHARLDDKGMHPKEEPDKRIRHGHETVVPMTNKIRQELDPTITLRAHTIKAPYCGESFSRDKGTTRWIETSQLPKCEKLRDLYLKRMQAKHPKDKKYFKKYTIDDRLP
jgi:hypothetical protein